MTSRTPTTVRALAAAGLASLALAAPAAADYEFYAGEVDATVHTEYTGAEHTPTFGHDSSLALDTRVRSYFLASIDRDASGRIVGATGGDQHDATTTGTATTVERRYDEDWADWWQYGSSCTGAGKNKNDEGRTTLRPDPLTPLVGGALILNLADKLAVELDCEQTGANGPAGPRSFVIESPVPDDEFGPTGPLAVEFSLPPEATAAGKVIQLFEGPAEGHAAYCPESLAERPYRRSCRVTFRGTITLTKTDLGLDERPSTQPGPAPAPAPTPAPAPAPAPAPDSDDDLLAPLVPASQRAAIDARGSRLTFRAACPAGCSGTATVLAPTAGKGRAAQTAAKRTAKPRTLAVIRFAIPRSARPRTVRLTVPRHARAALRAARGKATVKLVLRPRGGKAVTRALGTARR